MAEDKTKQPDEELQDEQLDNVSGGLRCQDSIYHEGVDE